MPIFKFCAVSEDVRIELKNKASIIGFYGMLPYVQILVSNPSAPIGKLTFLMMSGDQVPAGKYRVRLSVKDPRNQELTAPIDAATADSPLGPWNFVITVEPFGLTGAGIYRIAAVVNGKEDFVGNLQIHQGPPET